MRRWRLAPTDLARRRVVLGTAPARRTRLALATALLAALLTGAAASAAWWHHHTGRWLPQVQPAQQDPKPLLQGLAQDLTTAQLQVRVAQARSLELERQVDTLNQSLHACQEEVTFFRKAVNGKR